MNFVIFVRNPSSWSQVSMETSTSCAEHFLLPKKHSYSQHRWKKLLSQSNIEQVLDTQLAIVCTAQEIPPGAILLGDSVGCHGVVQYDGSKKVFFKEKWE